VAALQSNCNIIPIIDNFQWPEPEELPEDMRAVCHFNGVRYATNISVGPHFLTLSELLNCMISVITNYKDV